MLIGSGSRRDGSWSAVSAVFRQWLQPREFRIRLEPWPEDALRVLSDKALIRSVPPPAARDDAGMERFAARIATSVWRLRGRAAALPTELRSVTRHIEALSDTLTQTGVDIQDHVNMPFDPGLALTVVAYQPTAGINREQVIEAITPSVYLHDRLIQKAEVIVGTPETPHAPESALEPTEENDQAHG